MPSPVESLPFFKVPFHVLDRHLGTVMNDRVLDRVVCRPRKFCMAEPLCDLAEFVPAANRLGKVR